MNQVAESLTGWFVDEARGLNIDEIMELVDKNGQGLINPLVEVLKSNVPATLQSSGLLMVSRYGRRYKIDSSAAPIRDNNGTLTGAVLVFRDVTNAERVQEELFKLRKLETVGRLAGGIAHDFNNLLTGIMGNLDLALAVCPPENRYYANLQKALRATQRASDLTCKLLTFAKGGEPIKKTTFLPDIIAESAEFSLLGSKVALHTDFADDLWNIEADPGQISQVIQNLAINAKEAMPGGGNLFISCWNMVHRTGGGSILPLAAGSYVAIAVRDEGQGIPAELQGHVFDPFFSTKETGSGLGLSVTHAIVSRHGGHIEVSSEEGAGTEFVVYLPATTKPVPQQAPSAAAREVEKAAPARILVMDDEDFIRELLVETLGSRGYQVTAVADGEAAIEKYRREKFDLVIMDMTIPGGMGGAEAIKIIREIDPEVKAIVSSGYSNNDFLVNYRRHGFAGFLGKPYEMAALLSLVAELLQE
ncbi:MAG: response regulator [Deltaproteobacteria bacterium]|nr:response regulator [Deltaproteobacteria bacterium]